MSDNTAKTIGIQVVAIAAAIAVGSASWGNPWLAMATYTAIATLGGILLPPEAAKSNFSPQGLSLQTSQYGIVVPVLYGTRKMTGNLIWYGNFQTHESSSGGGGKGGSQPEQTTITYSVSMAWGLCFSRTNKATATRMWVGKDEVYLVDVPGTTESGTVACPESPPFNIYDPIFAFSHHAEGYWVGGNVKFTSGYYNGITYPIMTHYDGYVGLGTPSTWFDYFPMGDTFEATNKTTEAIEDVTVYDGSQTTPDSHIQAMLTAEGKTRFPVWKNLTYVVMENYDLGSSPQIPQFSFEVACEGGGSGDQTLIVVAPQYDANAARMYALINYNGILYSGEYQDGRLFKWNGLNAWIPVTGILSGGSGYIADLVEFSGELYGIEHLWSGDTGGKLYKWNGVDAWILIVDKIDGVPISGMTPVHGHGMSHVSRLCVYDDDIYATIYNTGKLYRWSAGSSWTTVAAKYGSESRVPSLCVYNGKLYGGTYPGGKLLEFSGTSWVEKATLSGTYDIGALVVFGSELYGGDYQVGNFYKWNGVDAWSYLGATGDMGITVLISFNEQIHIQGARGTLFKWDGTNVVQVVYTIQGDVWAFAILNNYLYMSSSAGLLIKYNYEALYTISDDYPSEVSKDALTNTLYGLGLSSSYLDLTKFDSTKTYCTANDLLVSFLFNSQMSVLDALSYIISHHNGYITYYDGKIAHNQFSENDASSATLTYDSIVKEEESTPYIQIGTPAERDTYNKINIEYTKRIDDYVIGTALADDIVDIDKRGLADVTMKLDGLMTYDRAAKMANLLLIKNMLITKTYSMNLGIQHFGTIRPGIVATLTDANTETFAQPIRILNVSETSDYKLEIEAMDEEAEQYQYTIIGEDSSTPPSAPNLFLSASSVLNPLAVEFPPLYYSTAKYGISYTKPDEDQWRGASLYKSYVSGSDYSRIDTANVTGVTGTVLAVGTSGTINYIDIQLYSDHQLESAIDFDTLLSTPLKNLCVIKTATKDVFMRYEDVTLIGTNQWRLSNLIYDTVDFPLLNTYGDVVASNKIIIYSNIPFIESINDFDILKTLYFKIPSVNFAGTEQSLADVSAITFTNENLNAKPLAPYNIKINDIGINNTNTIKVSVGNITIEWFSRNRFNTGGYNYTRSDAIGDDSDFLEFQLEIYNGTTLLRTVNQTGKSFVYTSSMQVSDGGHSSYIIKVKQRNNSIDSDYSPSITVIIT